MTDLEEKVLKLEQTILRVEGELNVLRRDFTKLRDALFKMVPQVRQQQDLTEDKIERIQNELKRDSANYRTDA